MGTERTNPNPAVQRIVRRMEREDRDKTQAHARQNGLLRDAKAAALELEFRESGLSRSEWEAQHREKRELAAAHRQAIRQQAARQAERRDELAAAFVAEHAPAALGLPDAAAVALALSEGHKGGQGMRMVDLLQEAHLATAEDASRVSKSRVGKDLAAELRRLNWTHRRWGSGPVWTPPRA